MTYPAWSEVFSEWNRTFSPPAPSNLLSNSTVKSRLDGRLGNEPARVTRPLFRSKEKVHGTWFTDSEPAKSMKEATGAPQPAASPRLS
jgi:hypothetical protein